MSGVGRGIAGLGRRRGASVGFGLGGTGQRRMGQYSGAVIQNRYPAESSGSAPYLNTSSPHNPIPAPRQDCLPFPFATRAKPRRDQSHRDRSRLPRPFPRLSCQPCTLFSRRPSDATLIFSSPSWLVAPPGDRAPAGAWPAALDPISETPCNYWASPSSTLPMAECASWQKGKRSRHQGEQTKIRISWSDSRSFSSRSSTRRHHSRSLVISTAMST